MNQMNGIGLNAIQRPTPFYPGASVNMTATQVNGGGVTNETPTAADEGRMSVSIDFGASLKLRCIVFRLTRLQVLHSLVWLVKLHG